jgi:hypothetical protein
MAELATDEYDIKALGDQRTRIAVPHAAARCSGSRCVCQASGGTENCRCVLERAVLSISGELPMEAKHGGSLIDVAHTQAQARADAQPGASGLSRCTATPAA